MAGRDRWVVVGAGLAATRFVEEARRLGADAGIVLVGDEVHEPYDRPPLSKDVLTGKQGHSGLREDWDGLGVEWRLGRRAVGLDAKRAVVALDDGGEVAYDALVIATGARPRRLAGLAGAGVHVLRTRDDARAIADDIRAHGRVTVVGGGFIGCEVASSARAMGAEATLVEVLDAPLLRVLGPEVAAEVARLHTDAGVDLRCGVSVAEVRGDGAGRRLVLSDGTEVDGSAVVVGLGVDPCTDWLDGSGVAVDGGVVCDEFGRTSVDRVWAAGDVARWRHPWFGAHVRLEHWTSAIDQGRQVAQALCGQPEPLAEVPYFWSDQHGVKLQMLGRPQPGDEVTLLRVGPDQDRLLAVYGRDGRVAGVLGVAAPRWVMRLRGLLADHAPYAEAIAAATA